MPVMDGLEATREIRNSIFSNINPDIPIIAITAHALKGVKEYCLKNGMTDYLSKPVSLKQLLNIVEKYGKKAKGCVTPNVLNNMIIDEKLILSKYNGNRRNLENVFSLFIKQAISHQRELEQALEQENHNQVEWISNWFKINALNIGSGLLKNIAFRMQLASRKKSLSKANALLADLKQALQKVTKALKSFMEKAKVETN